MNLFVKRFFNKLIRPRIINYHSVLLKIDSALVSRHIENILYNYTYEKEEITILAKVLDENDIVMEVGAGIGFLSVFCSKINNNRVFAYEANPELIKLIQENYKLNRVTPQIKNVVLSNKIGETDFYIERNFYSSSTIKRTKEGKSIKVKTIDINEEILKYKITFLIMDIEGGEKDLVEKIDYKNTGLKKILIELHPHIIGDMEVNKILKHIIDNGFLLDTAKSGNYVYYFYRNL